MSDPTTAKAQSVARAALAATLEAAGADVVQGVIAALFGPSSGALSLLSDLETTVRDLLTAARGVLTDDEIRTVAATKAAAFAAADTQADALENAKFPKGSD